MKYGAPEPVGASLFNFDLKRRLDAAYTAYSSTVNQSKPFWTDGAQVENSNSITSFLCTDESRDIFEEGARRLEQMACDHRGFVMPCAQALPARLPKSHREPPKPRTNVEVLEDCRRFRIYAKNVGRRATQHK